MKKQIILSFLLLSTALSAMEDKTKKYLLEFKGKNQYEKNQLLIEAAKKGKESKVNVLISLGADINACDSSGDTPLHKATAKRHVECVCALLTANADFSIENNSGQTAWKITNSAHIRAIIDQFDDKTPHSLRVVA